MSEFWYPGWTATVNGVATEIEQVNGALRAVAVPAGASTVTLTYWPSTLTWGFLAAAAGIVFLAFLTLWLRPKSTSTGSA